MKIGRCTSASLVARNTILNLLTEGSLFVVLVVTMPILVSLLGEKSFGLFSLGWIAIGFLTLLDVGVSRAATQFVSGHLPENNLTAIRQVVHSALSANVLIGLLGGTAVILLSPVLVHSVFKVPGDLKKEAQFVFYAVSFAMPVLLVQGTLRAVLTSYQRFGWINLVYGVTTTVQWVLACFLAWRGVGVGVVVVSTVAVRVVATAAYAALLFRLLRGVHCPGSNLGELPKLLRFGSWVTISQLTGQILAYLDRVLIAHFLSLDAVTLYTVPYEAISRLRIVPSSLVAPLFPAMSERVKEKQRDQLQALYSSSLRYLLLVLVPGISFLVVFGGDILSVWLGSNFASKASPVLQVLAVGVLLNCLAYVPCSALQAWGRPDLVGKFHLVALPVYIGLCLYLMPHWGIVGAALAATLRFGLDALLLFGAAQKYCSCSLRSTANQGISGILRVGLLLSLVMLAARFVVAAVWMRLGIGLLAVAIYFFVIWHFMLDSDEKPAITRALNLSPHRTAP